MDIFISAICGIGTFLIIALIGWLCEKYEDLGALLGIIGLFGGIIFTLSIMWYSILFG